MMKIIFLPLLLAIFSLHSFAQKYTTAAGIRIGSGLGITVQQHVFNKLTIEGNLQKNLFKPGTHFSVLAERHIPIAFKSFNFYLGGGPHIDFYPSTSTYDDKGNRTIVNNNAYGVSAIGGIELQLQNLLISYDYQPGINFHGGNIFNSRTGISVRYILFKPAKKEKEWMFWKKKNK